MLVVAILLSLLMCLTPARAADPNEGITLWGLTADGANHAVTLRLGGLKDGIELGGTIKYWDWQPDWGPSPDGAGGYAILHVPEIIDVEDVPLLPDSWKPYLDRMIGRPYIGFEGIIPLHKEGRTPKINWLIGTLISLDPQSKRAIVLEAQSGQGVSHDADTVVTVGAMFLW